MQNWGKDIFRTGKQLIQRPRKVKGLGVFTALKGSQCGWSMLRERQAEA